MIEITYTSPNYKESDVTGRYVRVFGKKGSYQFKVFEAATCWQKGVFYGQEGMGWTLREYVTDGEELPEELKERCIVSKTTEKWD